MSCKKGKVTQISGSSAIVVGDAADPMNPMNPANPNHI